jgi:hypothetical protein
MEFSGVTLMVEDTLVHFIFCACVLETKPVLKATLYRTGLKLSLHPWTEPFGLRVIDPNFTVVRELEEV